MKELTDRQWEQVYAHRQQWLDRGMSTDRTDRPVVEAAMAALYASRGYDRPLMVWADSPASSLLMAAACQQLRLQLGEQFGEQLRDQLGDQLWDQLWDQLRVQLGDQFRVQLGDRLRDRLRVQLGDRLRDRLRDQVGDQLRDQLWDQLGPQLRGQLWDQFRNQLWEQLGDQLRGQLGIQFREQIDDIWDQLGEKIRKIYRGMVMSGWDAAWVAHYAIPRDLGHVTYTADTSALLDAYATVTYGCTSWTPHQGICFLSDLPTDIRMVGQYLQARLHNPDGPAIAFNDGWGVYAWRGTRVPESLTAGDGWTVEQILAEPNAEIRRCAIERMGWDIWIDAAGLSPVDACPDPGNPGHDLRLYNLPDKLNPFEEPVRILVCVNGSPERDGTRRRFGLTVPADVATALEAAAWGYSDDDHPLSTPASLYSRLARRS